MRLNELLREVQYNRLVMPNNEIDVLGVNIDSRKVQKGDMFIAMKGTQVDGHEYIAAAE
ncbi:MAG: UDP-N-acetylmuramoyl-L-alanyl-D-glutamate--2,6-diaminopimelate ligase, partial [Bacteroidaceae bacterium]|nr:UDP-N-acetylmuramoyl-L-alanyl-D-glutamate--2,6-diaminopimelate ligase [Bacteroidaceae bacterium]